jgi:hypothetical protein
MRAFAGLVLMGSALALLASCGSPEPAATPDAPAAPAPTKYWVSKFMGGVTHNWFPEEQLDYANVDEPMVAYEVTTDPNATPTAEDQQRAKDFVRATFDAAKRHGWFDYDTGLADGFQLMHDDPLHFAKPEYVEDDEILNPDKPEFLMYYDTERGKMLAGVMYLTRSPHERGPQFGGPLTIWHYHIWDTPRCLKGQMLVCGDPQSTGDCAEGEATRRSPEMIHVWLFDHPHGRFASTMALPAPIIKILAERGF